MLLPAQPAVQRTSVGTPQQMLLLLRSNQPWLTGLVSVTGWSSGASRARTASHCQDDCCSSELLTSVPGSRQHSALCATQALPTPATGAAGTGLVSAEAGVQALGRVTLLCPGHSQAFWDSLALQVRAFSSDSSTLLQIPAGSFAFGKFVCVE